MKRRILVKMLEQAGFREKHGGSHDRYVRGKDTEIVPRHSNINEKLAKSIIKKWGLK